MTSIIKSICLSKEQKKTLTDLLNPIHKISRNDDIDSIINSSISVDIILDELQRKESSKFYCNNNLIYIYFLDDSILFHRCGDKGKDCTQYNINIDGVKIDS